MRRRIGMVMIMLAFVTGISAIAVFGENEGTKGGTGNPGYEICEMTYMLPGGCSFQCIQVCGMKDKELEDKVNSSLTRYFSILIEPWFLKERIRTHDPVIHMQTDRYLSVEYVFDYITALDQRWYLCVTVDMQTGDVVFLDDLVDISVEFAETVKYGGILKVTETGAHITPEEATEQTNRHYAKFRSIDSILVEFGRFTHKYLYGDYIPTVDRSEEWKIDMWSTVYCRFYYLEEGCIRYAGNAEGLFRPRLMTEDIEEYLKVEPW